MQLKRQQTRRREDEIVIHTEDDLVGMRQAGQLAAAVLDHVTPHVAPSVTTEQLNTLCHDFILAHGAVPAPLNYKGFPKSICTSINHVVCHGIPGPRKLHDGDILNIDVTVILNGWYGDTSRMFTVGERVGIKAHRLIAATHEALMRGIEAVRPGAHLGDIGHAIQAYVEPMGYSVVRDFCGHGLGRAFHQPPSVMHVGRLGDGPMLQEGMFFTIEPMVYAGRFQVKILADNWTAVTKDKSLSAQFEHTVAVVPDGVEVLTYSPKGWDRPPYA